jgi:hypothetical protein
MRLFFPPFFFYPRLFCSIFFYSVLGRFVTRGVQKRDKKKSRENLLGFQNKHLLTYVSFFFFFAAPLVNLAFGFWLRGFGKRFQTREARALARPKGFAWSLIAFVGRCLFGLGSSVGAPSPADPLIL